jgi:YVTN family beta-propeller protein
MRRLRGKFILGLVAAAILSACGNVPVIRKITPDKARPGQVIEIGGETFGSSQGKGFVKFKAGSSGPVTVAPQTDIVSWKNDAIVLRVPAALAEGEYSIQLENDFGNPSNKKAFTVLSGSVSPGKTLVVANEGEPGLQVWDVVLDGTAFAAGEPIFEISLAEAGAETSIRSLAAAEAVGKFYAAVVRRDLDTGAETSALVSFGDADGDVTAPTLIDVGVEPTGLAASPDGTKVYVAATASGIVSVVNTATNLVESNLGLDLAAYSYGFEPLGLAAYAAPSTAYGSDTLVTVTGNNWFLARGEVITFAPGATVNTIVSHLILDGLQLSGPLAVSAATAKVWVVGDAAGKPTLASLDVTGGRVLEQRSFESLPGFSGSASSATDVLADVKHMRVWAAVPGAGVAEMSMSADATVAVDAVVTLHPVNAAHLAPLAVNGTGFDAVLGTLTDSGAVAIMEPTGDRTDFATTRARPTLILTYSAAETEPVQ